jgi:Ca-activated chloride channel homolog
MTIQLGSLVILQPGWLILAVVLFLATLFIRRSAEQSAWVRVIAAPVLHYLEGDRRLQSKAHIALLAASIAAASLCEPVIRQSDDNTWRHSIGWVIAADVSRSMTLTDTVPSRLSAVREALAELSELASARPISLILFAGDAFLVSPPAFDRSVFNEHAALLEYGIIPAEGSNLSRALSLAAAVIDDSGLVQARILLLTDTGGISKASTAAANFLADAGHQLDVLVVGVARDAAATLSVPDAAAVDIAAARALAAAGNGRAIIANRFGNFDYDALDLELHDSASTHQALKSLVWRQQSHWLLLLALPLMLWLFLQDARG